MARVQTTFTYTLPAKASDTVAPAAPIKCGCNNIIFILSDESLTVTAKRGIVEAIIREIAVSSKPLAYVAPGSGESTLVWRYDYVFEYEATDFVDPTYRLRKCDIAYNCCRGCAQEYTDRQLGGYVKSVLGADVNNTDPQNPVIPPETTTTIARALVGTADSGYYRLDYTNEDGVVFQFVDGISSIVAPAGCSGVGPGQAVRAMAARPNQIYIESAAMPSFVQAGAVQALDPVGPLFVTALGFYQMADLTITITNPNACYTLQGMLYPSNKTFVSPMTDSTRLQLQSSVTVDPDPAVYGVSAEMHSGATPPGAPQGVMLGLDSVMFLNELIPAGIPPLGSATIRLRVRIENLTGGAPGTFITNSFSGLRFQGMAS